MSHSRNTAIYEVLTASMIWVQLDILLAQLLTVCHVDIMPGEMDPSNLTMPQQVTR
jgi:DNA polymerase II small subunit/DNA polymerase delta subunit B